MVAAFGASTLGYSLRALQATLLMLISLLYLFAPKQITCMSVRFLGRFGTASGMAYRVAADRLDRTLGVLSRVELCLTERWRYVVLEIARQTDL